MRKWALYARTSTNRQEKGLEAQVRALQAFALQKGITEFDLFTDEGISEAGRSQINSPWSFSTQNYLAEWLERPIMEILGIEIETLIESVFGNHAIASRAKLLRMIKEVFRRQIQLGYLKENPAGEIKCGKIPDRAIATMSREEIAKLLNEAERTDHPWFPIWKVVYELGLRSGEGLGLRWTDINFNDGMVLIQRSYCSKLKGFKHTKTKQTRAVPLSSDLIFFLKELREKEPTAEFVTLMTGREAKQPKYFDDFRRTLASPKRTFILSVHLSSRIL